MGDMTKYDNPQKAMAGVIPAGGKDGFISVGAAIQIPNGAEDTDEYRQHLAREGQKVLRAQWDKKAIPHLVMQMQVKLRGDNGCVLVRALVSAMDPKGVQAIRRFRKEQSEQQWIRKER